MITIYKVAYEVESGWHGRNNHLSKVFGCKDAAEAFAEDNIEGKVHESVEGFAFPYIVLLM